MLVDRSTSTSPTSSISRLSLRDSSGGVGTLNETYSKKEPLEPLVPQQCSARTHVCWTDPPQKTNSRRAASHDLSRARKKRGRGLRRAATPSESACLEQVTGSMSSSNQSLISNTRFGVFLSGLWWHINGTGFLRKERWLERKDEKDEKDEKQRISFTKFHHPRPVLYFYFQITHLRTYLNTTGIFIKVSQTPALPPPHKNLSKNQKSQHSPYVK